MDPINRIAETVRNAVLNQGPTKRVGVGIGIKYTDNIVNELLECSIDGEQNFFSESDKEFFEGSRCREDRISLDFKESEKVYKGSWYYQYHEPTCVSWSVVNAIHSIGVKPNTCFVTETLNSALDVEHKFEGLLRKGSSYSETKSIFDKFPNIDFDMVKFPNEMTLLNSENGEHLLWLAPVKCYPTFVQYLEDFQQTQKLGDELKQESEILKMRATKHNGILIKSILDEESSIVTNISQKFYPSYGGISCVPHAISIVGHKVSSKGEMDVQIIDPSCGITWISLEHLSSSIHTPYDNYKISKKSYS